MNTFLDTLKTRVQAAVEALYAFERKAMLPLPVMLGGVVFLLIVLCLVLVLVFRPGEAGMPFAENFDGDGAASWPASGGAWEVRDGALVQLDATAADAAKMTPLRVGEGEMYRFSAQVRHPEGAPPGAPGGGLAFNAPQEGGQGYGHVARFAAENNVLYARYGYYDAAGAFVPQGSAPLPLLPNNTGWQRLGVWVGPDTYHVLVNNEVVAANIPLQYRGGALGLVAGGGLAAFDDVEADRWEPVSDRIQVAETPVPVLQGEIRTAVDLGPLRFSDSFDDPEASEAQWLPFTGDWTFEPGFFVQRQVDGYDRSASAGERFESFVLRATFAHREGAGGGVLFNMARRDVLTEAHIVRYFGSSEVLAWGYFDADGVFQAQGTAAVPAAGTATHTLEVRAELGVYSVSLDGALVATDAPLMTGSGYIGLTSSESAVAFESVEVYDTASDADAAAMLDLSASDGAWLSADGVITQLSSAQRDFVAGTGIAASAFRASVDVLLPQGEGLEFAGGGIAFHMTGRDNRAGGYVVRFATGGREVIWGAFDEGGAFKEQGNAPVEPEPGAPHTLTVVVRADNFDILVDGALIVSNLLLERADGWVGLVSFQGPVSFSDFQMTLSEAEGQ